MIKVSRVRVLSREGHGTAVALGHHPSSSRYYERRHRSARGDELVEQYQRGDAGFRRSPAG